MSPSASREKTSLEPGQVIAGKYRIEGEIGSGGMGIVVSARHVAMNNRVAIKLLRVDDDHDPGDAVARFLREARAVARIESDHVVRVMDVAALEDGTPYMVMELLEGGDFRKLLFDRGPLPVEDAVGYVLQACEGLAEAHAAGVIHRDLKPSNLFLARKANGTQLVKVLDFGISKVLARAGEAAITTTNALMGSPVYMAPEQMRQSRSVDARADVWSLGLILYELLAGEPPFGGDTIPEVCVAVMSLEPTAISRFRDDVPLELQAILVKCLSKEREDRYASMGALARDLAQFAHERSRVHADRASAALKAARAATVETLPEVAAPPSSDLGGIRGRRTPQTKRDPETLKSWSGARGGEPWRPRPVVSRRVAWISLAAIAAVIAATIGARLAHGPTLDHAATTAAPRATTPATSPIPPPPPVTTSDALPSVPIDSLPIATRDAGAARAPRSYSPQPGRMPTSSAAAPATSSSAAPPKKDDWQWGDRN